MSVAARYGVGDHRCVDSARCTTQDGQLRLRAALRVNPWVIVPDGTIKAMLAGSDDMLAPSPGSILTPIDGRPRGRSRLTAADPIASPLSPAGPA